MKFICSILLLSLSPLELDLFCYILNSKVKHTRYKIKLDTYPGLHTSRIDHVLFFIAMNSALSRPNPTLPYPIAS